MRSIDTLNIPCQFRERGQNSGGITCKPHIHRRIVSSVIPRIIRYKAKRDILDKCFLVGESRCIHAYCNNTFHNAVIYSTDLTFLTDLRKNIHIRIILVVRPFRAIQQRTSGNADPVCIRLDTLIGHRITYRHIKRQFNLIAFIPHPADREKSILKRRGDLSSIHFHRIS